MELRRVVRALTLLIAFSLCLVAQQKSAQIDALLAKYHEHGYFNGSDLVAENRSVILRKGSGMANMEWDIPNTPETRFRIGSITKQFTSAIILQLENEGKLNLHDPLSRYLPDYPAKVADKVTVHHLLNHTSGIPSYTGLPDFAGKFSRDPYSVQDFIKVFSSLDLEFEPGTKYSYSNSGYFLLGAIIENVTGEKYEQQLQKRITTPLGLTATGYDWHAPLIPMRARGYDTTLDGYRNAPYLDMSLPYSAGSMYSTVEDLHTWDQALYTDAVLPPASREIWFKPGLGNYCYGWIIREADHPGGDGKLKLIEHGGGINGFNTLISRIPDDRHLVVLLNNTGGAPLSSMAEGIRNILYGKPATMPKKPAAPLMLQTYRENGTDAALAQYKQWKASEDNEIDTGSRELDRFARYLLQQKQTADAAAVMQLRTEQFPEDWQGFIGLGDTQKANGDNDAARKSYARALTMCPEGAASFVINKLNELGVSAR